MCTGTVGRFEFRTGATVIGPDDGGRAPDVLPDVDVVTIPSYCSHMAVGVRVLKEHLSEYLERAARGEIILVTDRGVPRAVLGPAPGGLNLELGIAEKWIRAGNGEPPRMTRRFKPRVPTIETLLDDRGR